MSLKWFLVIFNLIVCCYPLVHSCYGIETTWYEEVSRVGGQMFVWWILMNGLMIFAHFALKEISKNDN